MFEISTESQISQNSLYEVFIYFANMNMKHISIDTSTDITYKDEIYMHVKSTNISCANIYMF